MKLEVGMYVRTNYGTISKIIADNRIRINNFLCINTFDGKSGAFIKIKSIIKSSHNIIDLIEVGDYVNGLYVAEKFYDYGNEVWEIVLSTTEHIKIYKNQSKIKTILTKEQYESYCYKVGD